MKTTSSIDRSMANIKGCDKLIEINESNRRRNTQNCQISNLVF